jgi:hypothetical protein
MNGTTETRTETGVGDRLRKLYVRWLGDERSAGDVQRHISGVQRHSSRSRASSGAIMPMPCCGAGPGTFTRGGIVPSWRQ